MGLVDQTIHIFISLASEGRVVFLSGTDFNLLACEYFDKRSAPIVLLAQLGHDSESDRKCCTEVSMLI